jgi:transcription elongation GreA/GreB family factor
MSRAFVKEQDIDAELATARTAYAAAQKSGGRAALASASRDMRYWSSRRATARIIIPPENHDQVRFGATGEDRKGSWPRTDVPDRR